MPILIIKKILRKRLKKGLALQKIHTPLQIIQIQGPMNLCGIFRCKKGGSEIDWILHELLYRIIPNAFARTVSLRLTSCRIELTQSLLNYPALRDSLASSFLTNLRKQAFDIVSK